MGYRNLNKKGLLLAWQFSFTREEKNKFANLCNYSKTSYVRDFLTKNCENPLKAKHVQAIEKMFTIDEWEQKISSAIDINPLNEAFLKGEDGCKVLVPIELLQDLTKSINSVVLANKELKENYIKMEQLLSDLGIEIPQIDI